jgi:hypothetical protein
MPAKKKAAKKTKAPKPVTIQYKCNPTCQARPKHPEIHRNGTVVLTAAGTDVTLDFISSPFKSRHKHISITAGNSVTEVIDPSAKIDEYFYSLACSACTNPIGDPSMIVEP